MTVCHRCSRGRDAADTITDRSRRRQSDRQLHPPWVVMLPDGGLRGARVGYQARAARKRGRAAARHDSRGLAGRASRLAAPATYPFARQHRVDARSVILVNKPETMSLIPPGRGIVFRR